MRRLVTTRGYGRMAGDCSVWGMAVATGSQPLHRRCRSLISIPTVSCRAMFCPRRKQTYPLISLRRHSERGRPNASIERVTRKGRGHGRDSGGWKGQRCVVRCSCARDGRDELGFAGAWRAADMRRGQAAEHFVRGSATIDCPT